MRKRKKLYNAQLFTLTQAVDTSLLEVDFHHLSLYRYKFSWLYVRKHNKMRCVRRVHKRKKLSVVQLFMFMNAFHMLLFILFIYLKPTKFMSVRT